eukprot:TRINITY_DN44362_c0_g1_i1.p1 TRINITY_DN44362_c0_g1~~TRINITY_DN44362_c0_g1_i1.p1  ORF type:complete len:441 (+),score=120.81 TRINITY_DN44362_c0_g1_i1:72-1394(+)
MDLSIQWKPVGVGQPVVNVPKSALPGGDALYSAHEASVGAEEQSKTGLIRQPCVAAHRAAADAYLQAADDYKAQYAKFIGRRHPFSARIVPASAAGGVQSPLRPASQSLFGRSSTIVEDTLQLMRAQHLQEAKGHEASVRMFDAATADRRTVPGGEVSPSAAPAPAKPTQQKHKFVALWQVCGGHFRRLLAAEIQGQAGYVQADAVRRVLQLMQKDLAHTAAEIVEQERSDVEAREQLLVKHRMYAKRQREVREVIAKYVAVWKSLQQQKNIPTPREKPQALLEVPTGGPGAAAVVPCPVQPPLGQYAGAAQLWETCRAAFEEVLRPCSEQWHLVSHEAVKRLFKTIHLHFREVAGDYQRRIAVVGDHLRRLKALNDELQKELTRDNAHLEKCKTKWDQLKERANKSRSQTAHGAESAAQSAAQGSAKQEGPAGGQQGGE